MLYVYTHTYTYFSVYSVTPLSLSLYIYIYIYIHVYGRVSTKVWKKVWTGTCISYPFSHLRIFDVFHTLDRESLAKEFKKYENKIKFKKFFIQINTGDEASKSGIHPNKAGDFISHCVNDLKINVVGLMCIPPVDENPLTHFDCIKEIAKKNNLGNLSMGMSNDFKAAIKSGSTHIRVGSLLFGKRI